MNEFQPTRFFADLLTVSRVLLSIYLAGLGATQGSDALSAVVLIVLLSWFTDLLDGPLARLAPDHQPTWVGRHDAEADLSTSLGLAIYLALSGYIPVWLGIAVVLATVAVWLLHSHQLAWPLYAVPYGILGMTAFREAPLFGWLLLGYLLIALSIRWSRLRDEFLPEFFQAFAHLLGKDDGHIQNGR